MTIHESVLDDFADVRATQGWFVTPAGTACPLAKRIEAVPLRDFLARLQALFS